MNVELILVPFDSAQRGARLGAGPERLLEAGLGRALSENGATVRTSTIELPVDSWRAEIGTGFQLAAEISRRVRAAREGGAFPVVLVGNCLSTLGVVAGLGSEVGVLWFDAHGDFNTPETTVGGFLDGMGLAALTGRCWTTIAAGVPGFRPIDESHVFLIGARDIDPLEAELLDGSRINRIDAGSVDATLPSLVRRSLPRDLPVHLHLDLDVTDSADGRANQFAAPNGNSRGHAGRHLRSTRSRAAAHISHGFRIRPIVRYGWPDCEHRDRDGLSRGTGRGDGSTLPGLIQR